MVVVVNLSDLLEEYSVHETICAFVRLCNKYGDGCCLSHMPTFFQNSTNYLWVAAQLKLNETSLIKPYKLGLISTDEFLNTLSEIFKFIEVSNEETRRQLLIQAWNISIKLNDTTESKLQFLLEKAKTGTVYLISNTNELNLSEALTLFLDNYKKLPFGGDYDRVLDNKAMEVLPNIFVLGSCQAQQFKPDIIQNLLERHQGEEITFVSKYESDRQCAAKFGVVDIFDSADYFDSAMITKKIN